MIHFLWYLLGIVSGVVIVLGLQWLADSLDVDLEGY